MAQNTIQQQSTTASASAANTAGAIHAAHVNDAGNADKVSPVRLQRRLMLMLITPLCLLGIVSAVMDYRSASTAASQQDQQLLQLVPLLADSIIAVGAHADDPPVLLLAQPVEEFLNERNGLVSYKIYTPQQDFLHGDENLPSIVPLTREPEFANQQIEHTNYRIVSQRITTVAGDVIVTVADASDPRKHWLQQLFMKVLFPNIIMIGLIALFVSWAVQQALRPLRDLTLAIENRSPRDLSQINEHDSPLEIRPLVTSLNRLFDMVNRQSETQRRFIADAAHQLRTPIAGLQAQIEAWSESVRHLSTQKHTVHKSSHEQQANNPHHAIELVMDEQTQTEMVKLPADELKRLHSAIRRISQLVSQLLSLSRADAADALETEAMQTVNLRHLCEQVLEQHLDHAAHKNIDLGVEGESITVQGHALWLQELLSNLLHNSLLYTPEEGIVTLRCGMIASEQAPAPSSTAKKILPIKQTPAATTTVYRAFLEVEDNGPGIPEAERKHAMERFYRLPGTKAEGTGLGLAIAKEIATRHQSELQLSDGIAHEDGSGYGLKVTLLFAPEMLLSEHGAPPAE